MVGILQAALRLTCETPASRLLPLARLILPCVLLLTSGCGEQEIRAIEPLPLPALPDRGRVQVRDGNLLTDKGTRLRGVTFGADAHPDMVFEPSLFAGLASETGLNAFHVYLENSAVPTGSHVTQADTLVELTSKAGMYLVLGIGGGATGGSFNLDRVRAFWSFYAARYASRTHVLFEILNIPDNACDEAYDDSTLAMQQESYDFIRALAPSTHIALFSFWFEPSGPALATNLDALEGGIDWSKASVAFHATPCVDQENVLELLGVTRARGVPAFASELPAMAPYATIAVLEQERVGWFNFEWLVRNLDLVAFRAAHDAAGISWCPDFGTWPEDSESCSTP